MEAKIRMIEKLKRILAEYKGTNDFELDEKMSLITDLGLNSLDLVELVCRIEDEFDIEIPDRAIKNFKTVKDVLEYIISCTPN